VSVPRVPAQTVTEKMGLRKLSFCGGWRVVWYEERKKPPVIPGGFHSCEWQSLLAGGLDDRVFPVCPTLLTGLATMICGNLLSGIPLGLLIGCQDSANL
jgi:hypothetical protein